MDLDPPHVALLALIARLEQEDQRSPYPGERRADRAAMEAEWQGPRDLMDAALATLDGATLIESVVDYNGAERGWKLQPYGVRFMDNLRIDAGGWPPARNNAGSPRPTPSGSG